MICQMMMTDEDFMRKALSLADRAYLKGEIPVGALIVRGGEIIAEGSNENRSCNDPTLHAELIAIRAAASYLGNERLTGCDLYVTKEPCCMCAGAIVHSRIRRVVIGTEDIRYGACGSVFNICGNEKLNHIPEIKFGVLKEESSAVLKRFFRERR